MIHIEQAWQENLLTVEGKILHEKAHETGGEKRGDVITTRGMPTFSNSLGIRGVCDIVEFHRDEDGVAIHGREGKYLPVPVEYKRGHPKVGDEDILQLCAQAMCLEEMLVCDIPYGSIFYGETRRRLQVRLDEQTRRSVREMFAEMHGLYKRGHTPKVKISKACKSCSLAEICVPKLGKSVSAAAYVRRKLEEADV